MDPLEPYRLLKENEELRERLRALAHENADLRADLDVAHAKISSLIPRATPEQEEEFRKQLAEGPWHDGDEVMGRTIAELEADHGRE